MSDENDVVEQVSPEAQVAAAAPEPTTAPEQVERVSQTPIDEDALFERFAQRLSVVRPEELEARDRRLVGTLEETLNRFKQSNRDANQATRAEFLKQQQELFNYIDQHFAREVAQGNMTAAEAEQKKVVERSYVRDELDKKVLQGTEQPREQPAVRSESEEDFKRRWKATWQSVADEYELNPADPEWKDFASVNLEGMGWDQAVSTIRKAARKADSKKEKRLAEHLVATSKQTEEQKRVETQKRQQAAAAAVPLDTGSAAPIVRRSRAAIEEELEKNQKSSPGADPIARKARLERQRKLLEELDKLPAD